MSYTEFNYGFADGKLKDSSYQLIGTRWPATGELVASGDMQRYSEPMVAIRLN